MFRFSLLLIAIIGMQGIAEASGYVGVVKDFSLPPMGKHFLIQHQDQSSTPLDYPETRLKSGDRIIFPQGLTLGSHAWVEIQVKGKLFRIHEKDSPWEAPHTEDGVISRISSAVSILYASVFPKESKSRFTQGMSRGWSAPTQPLNLLFAVKNSAQLISDDGQPYSMYWLGGKAPFSLQIEIDKHSRVISNIQVENKRINGKLLHLIPLPMEQSKAGRTHYLLRDSNGTEVSFETERTHQVYAIDEMLIDLDDYVLADGSRASRRLMLWHATESLPESSSKRTMIRWMLVNGEPGGSGQ